MPLFRIDWNGQGVDVEVVEEGDRFDALIYILEEWSEEQTRILSGVASFIAANGGQPVIPEEQVDEQTPQATLLALAHDASDLFMANPNLEEVFLQAIGVSVETVEGVE